MAQNKVSEAVIRRLPGYYRYLMNLERQGVTRISSQELGSRMGLTASQIRQDINCFGTLGQQGYGYNVAELKAYIGSILGLDRDYSMVIAGAGNIGKAVAAYPGFVQRGIRVRAMFEQDKDIIGQEIGGVPVLDIMHMGSYLQENHCAVGVVATPSIVAQKVADEMIANGVRAIWNFAPIDLQVPDTVALNNVHLTDSLLVLMYKLKEKEAEYGIVDD